MAKPLIAIATQDFAAYLELSRYLGKQDIPFASLEPGSPIPDRIRVVITTPDEEPRIDHDSVVPYTTPPATVEEAMRRIRGLETVTTLIIGIDPGERPGIAVVADGHILSSRQTGSPERATEIAAATADRYPDANVIIRIGHGAQTLRDRIVNALLDDGYTVQLVDESESSPPRQRLAGERDKVAARIIAMTRGDPIEDPTPIEVPPGEIRDIQRRSRIASDGQVTISRGLAGKVAQGTLSLAEAVRRQCANQS